METREARTLAEEARIRIATEGSTGSAWVGGMCMSPTLVAGMRLHIVALGVDEPRIGAIYAFEHEGRLFAHRCVEIERGAFAFQGDRPGAPTQRLTNREALVGRVDGVLLLGRHVPLEGPPLRLLVSAIRLALAVYRRLPAPLQARLYSRARTLLSR